MKAYYVPGTAGGTVETLTHLLSAGGEKSDDFFHRQRVWTCLKSPNQDLNPGPPIPEAPPAPVTAPPLREAGWHGHNSLSTRLGHGGLDLRFGPRVSQRHLNSCGAQGLPFAENLVRRRRSGLKPGAKLSPLSRTAGPFVSLPHGAYILPGVKTPLQRLDSHGDPSQGELRGWERE